MVSWRRGKQIVASDGSNSDQRRWCGDTSLKKTKKEIQHPIVQHHISEGRVLLLMSMSMLTKIGTRGEDIAMVPSQKGEKERK